MYQRFYGLRELPFEITPNPKFLFLTPGHREALSNLHYGVTSAKPLTVLLGEAGTGKTTLLRTAFESEQCRHVRWVYLNNPILTREDFVKTLAARFGLGAQAMDSKFVFLDELERVLQEHRSRDEIVALVVDEAQSLSNDLLEEIRLLTNIETATEKLLLLVLAGQPEFAVRLNDPELRQLKQRVALRCEIAPFGLQETGAYIASRVVTAGGDSSRLFTREAVRAIHEHSRGIPRTINVICDNALLGGLALGRQPVDQEIVMDVVGDFDLAPAQAGGRTTDEARTAGAVPERFEPPPPSRDDEEPQSRALFEQIANPRRFALSAPAGDDSRRRNENRR
jgi:general secretion pathway protein A